MNTLHKFLVLALPFCIAYAAGTTAQINATKPRVIEFGTTNLIDPKAEDIKIITIDFPNSSVEPTKPKNVQDFRYQQALKIHKANMAKAKMRKGPLDVSPEERLSIVQQHTYFRNTTFEMQKRGYVTVPNQDLEYTVNKATQQYTREREKKPEDIAHLMAFDSAIFSGSLDLKHVTGVFGGTDSEGRFHTLTSIIDYPPLRNVRIELHEMPLHDPEFGIESYTGPEFELVVNGNRASMTCLKSRDGKLGATYLIVLTDNVLARFELNKAITQKDPQFAKLMSLAKQLY